MKFLEIKNLLLADIRLGKYTEDIALPTRMELMHRYNVARGTVDKIFSELRKEGIIQSRQGRGSFLVKSFSKTIGFVIVAKMNSNVGEEFLQRAGTRDCRIIPQEQVSARLSELSAPGSRIVWQAPALEMFGFISNLHKAGIPQLLINRRHESYGFVCTDSRVGFCKTLEALKKKTGDVAVSILAAPITPTLPYWAEREMLFCESVLQQGMILKEIVRVKNRGIKAQVEAIQTLFSSQKIPRIIFTPEQSYLSTLLAISAEKGYECGKDFYIIATDRTENTEEPGVYALEQPFHEMTHIAIKWLKSKNADHLQKLIEPKLFYKI